MGETYTVGGGRSDYRLPTVSSADNGKILKVVEGEWNKAENSGGGGGGGETGIHSITVSGEGVTSDTWAEVYEYASSGTPCFVVQPFENEVIAGFVSDVFASGGDYTVVVMSCDLNSAYPWNFLTDSEDGYPEASTD